MTMSTDSELHWGDSGSLPGWTEYYQTAIVRVLAQSVPTDDFSLCFERAGLVVGIGLWKIEALP